MAYGTQTQAPTTQPVVPASTRRRTPVQTAGMALSILLVLAGAVWFVAVLTSSTTVEEISLDGAVATLAADVENGDIVVRAGDVERIELVRTVRRSFAGPTFAEEVSGGALQITADCPWYAVGQCGVSYELVVPPDLITEVRASSGDVVLEGLTGDMFVRSSSGDIVLRSTVGAVDAQASSGDVILENVTGDLVARSSSGDVVADGLSAGSVRVKASSGDIKLDLAETPDDIDLEASSGDIVLTVPDDGTAYAVAGDSSSGDRRIKVDTDDASPNRARVQTSSGDATFTYAD